ncbi:MAG: phytanoyl-CoA dioxygenase family protein [Rhodospirillales bacterium]
MRPVLRWLLMPLWLLQLMSGAKSFAANPLIGSAWLNRRGLHVWRTRLADRRAKARRRRFGALVSAAQRDAFERDGFLVIEDLLPDADFEALRAEVLATRQPVVEHQEGDALTRHLRLDPPVLTALPAVKRLLADPRWRRPLCYVAAFSVRPLLSVQSVFSQIEPANRDPQNDLHIDSFYCSMKAWYYLDDVPADAGPLVYVPGSQRLTKRRLAWQRRKSIAACDPATENPEDRRGSFRIDPAELARLRLSEPQRLAVKANSLVVADTFGFHCRAVSDRPGRRVALYAMSRPNPFLPVCLDLSGLPGLLRRWRLLPGDRLRKRIASPADPPEALGSKLR